MNPSRHSGNFPSSIRAAVCALLAFVCLAGTATGGDAAAPTDEIEALLRYIAALDGASFIRNGDAHSPKEAEAHLRLKWGQQKKDIRSAEDFIRLCATKSSISGKAYSIKFKDGREEEASLVLSKQLAALRSTASPP
jgi:Family of unknown function (DUF5329)